MVAQFVAWKGHMDFLRAARLVADTYPTARFLLVGDPEWHAEPGYVESLRSLVQQLRLTEHVHFLGQREDMPQVYAAFDILVVASWAEPFGKVLVEAMAMGKPVVATDAGGPPEIVEDGRTGLLVPPRHPHRLAGAIQRLASDPDGAQRMGQRGRQRIQGRFGAECYVREIEEQYGQLLASW
jgi:glycosyltransferase involved in cell wall biosynthesis